MPEQPPHLHRHSPGDAGHDHHHALPASQRQLFWALLLTGGCMLIEGVGGWIAGSLALLADSAHMLTDCASLAMSYAAVRAASRPATVSMSYGHHRWQVLAAFVNGLALQLLAVWIAVEALQRLRTGTSVQGQMVAGVAVIGLLVNIAAFVVLSRAEGSLNVRGALAHVVGDMLGSLAALIAGGVIVFTGWMPADPILSGVVALIMVTSGWRISRESAHILLEGAPADCDGELIEHALSAAVPAVAGVHHLHVWSLTDERPVVTLHAVLRENTDRDRVLLDIQSTLRARFGVEHATVQIELTQCEDDDCGGTPPASPLRSI
ncbi:MAG: cation diffusion facilitator family transporter [Steroidobacteraceae bacterium]